jgi:hypothetical protein
VLPRNVARAIPPGATEPAGTGLLHPASLFAIGVLLVNDHVLKEAWGGWWTGKLSDFAGLLLFPLLLQACWELGQTLLRRGWAPSVTVLSASVALTALAFAAVKLHPAAAGAFGFASVLLQWPVRVIAAIIGGDVLPALQPGIVVQDPTDLVALPMVLVSLWIGSRRSRNMGSV